MRFRKQREGEGDSIIRVSSGKLDRFLKLKSLLKCVQNVTESPCITHLLQAVIFCQIPRVPITANRNLHSGCFTHHTVRHTGVLLKERVR